MYCLFSSMEYNIYISTVISAQASHIVLNALTEYILFKNELIIMMPWSNLSVVQRNPEKYP